MFAVTEKVRHAEKDESRGTEKEVTHGRRGMTGRTKMTVNIRDCNDVTLERRNTGPGRNTIGLNLPVRVSGRQCQVEPQRVEPFILSSGSKNPKP